MNSARKGRPEPARKWLAGLATAIAWGLLATIAGYAVLRGAQAMAAPPLDATWVAWSVHIAFFWRIGMAAYGGGIVAFVAYALGNGRPDAMAKGLAPAIGVAVGMLALQAWLWP